MRTLQSEMRTLQSEMHALQSELRTLQSETHTLQSTAMSGREPVLIKNAVFSQERSRFATDMSRKVGRQQ